MTDELPPGWAMARLESLVGADGVMTDGDWVESKDQDPEGEVRLIQLADVGDGSFLDKSNRFMTRDKAEKLACTFLHPRDVLISRLGDPLGKTCLFPTLAQPCVTVVDVHVVRPASPEISREWLVHLINSPTVRRAIEAQTSGTTRKRITGQKLKDLEVAVAPAAEQHRIASKIDELFSRIDEGERALERVQKLVERYRQSVLKAAVTGELTRDWREKNKDQLGQSIEGGEALLARILKARREAWEKAELDKMKAKGITPANDKWKQKYEEPVAPDTSGLPELPFGWIWASVAQIGTTFTGKTPPTSQEDLFGGDIPFLKPTDLDQGYEVRTYRQTLTAKGAAFCDLLPAMSILVTCIGATIGKAGLARVQCTTNQQINSLVVDPHLFDPRFIYWLFASPHGQRQVISNSSSTTLPILNKSRFEALPVPVAPLSEQVCIVDVVEQRLNGAQHLMYDVEFGSRRSSALRQVVLRAAFGGQLVPQDSAEEPASALLERIAAECSQAPAKPKRGRKPKTSEPA